MYQQITKRGGVFVACATASLFITALVARADETLPVLRVGTNVYHRVTVMNVTTTDIYFSYPGGMGNAKLKNLDAQLQRHFHFDAAKADELEKNQHEGNALFRAELASRKAAPSQPESTEEESAPSAGTAGDIVVPRLYARSFRGRRPPQILLEKWLTPAPDLNGKFVLLDFWATWCRPCRQSIPHLNDLYARFRNRLVVIGISDESEEAVRSMTSPHIDYSVGLDTQARTLRAAGVTGIPHSILIDPKGIVRFEGMPDYLTAEGLQRLMDKYSN